MLQSKRLLNWFEEVWHKGNENAIDQLLHPNGIIHGLGTDDTKQGPEAFKPFYKNFRESFPSIHIELEPIVVNDDVEAAHCVVTGKDKDGKDVHFTGLSIVRFKDGQIIEAWNGFDFLTMYQQLGYQLMPGRELTEAVE